ncbi:hypothetical protein FJT64_026363 [Amphibalanus amphitrite]|uniref:DUF5641 domain-containing protein n=1 Tax=Amphibalanus amphitrite TaxID=1232801 RepID=A0A6A4WCB4_AMPAM|nr:hypothetical protein FJT64_026363 [Amphibalanus amphitrite]
MLVPVQLEHRDCPTSKEIVYALLDPQSDTCFVKDSVLQKMGVDGEEVALEVNTMTGKTVSKSQVIRGFTIRDLSGSQKIELPPTYSKEDIPAERQLIPRRETTAEWTHLREVSRELPEYRPEAEIGILIGVNCSKALKPLEVVTGGDDEPWAIRTSLGWSVVGYMGEAEETDGQEDSACLFISTEAGPKRIQHYAFRVDDIVLVVDDERPRSEWPLARVVATHPSGDHLVRKVRVLLGGSEYERPVHRLVLLLRRDCT